MQVHGSLQNFCEYRAARHAFHRHDVAYMQMSFSVTIILFTRFCSIQKKMAYKKYVKVHNASSYLRFQCNSCIRGIFIKGDCINYSLNIPKVEQSISAENELCQRSVLHIIKKIYIYIFLLKEKNIFFHIFCDLRFKSFSSCKGVTLYNFKIFILL